MLAPLRAAPPPFPLVFHRRTSPNLNATSAWCPISDMGLPFQFDIAEFPRSARFDAVAQSQPQHSNPFVVSSGRVIGEGVTGR